MGNARRGGSGGILRPDETPFPRGAGEISFDLVAKPHGRLDILDGKMTNASQCLPLLAETLDLFEAIELAEGDRGSEKDEAEEIESVAGESRAAAKPWWTAEK